MNYKDTYKSRQTDGRIRATKTATEINDSRDDEPASREVVSDDPPLKKIENKDNQISFTQE